MCRGLLNALFVTHFLVSRVANISLYNPRLSRDQGAICVFVVIVWVCRGLQNVLFTTHFWFRGLLKFLFTIHVCHLTRVPFVSVPNVLRVSRVAKTSLYRPRWSPARAHLCCFELFSRLVGC